MGLKIHKKDAGDGTFDAPVGKAKPATGPDYSEHLGGKAVQAKAQVQVSKTNNKSKQVTTLVDTAESVGKPVLIPAAQLAMVTVSGGQTINTGDYNSVKFTIGLTLPSNIHDIDETFEFASEWVSNRISQAVKDL